MKTKLLGSILGLALAATLLAAQAKEYPVHWGQPPAVLTRDSVPLPDGYGLGSSTLRNWIAANLEKDKVSGSAGAAKGATLLYQQNFDGLAGETLPDELMVLSGEFTVKADGTNKFLELPGTPLDSYAVLFGPAEKENDSVWARIFATAKGRRTPTFGVGLGGVSGFKLQVSPAKAALEILRDQASQTNVTFKWKSGTWTQFRLQVRKIKAGEWKVEGKAWADDTPEPEEWMIALETREEPIPGKASVLASPFSSTPIQFDDLKVERLPEK